MAWTTPKTWADTTDTPSASNFNTYIRDNFSHLKIPFDSSGRITALSSTYVANLSGANLTGVVFPASSATYTAGTHDFNAGSGTRVVLPVGANKWVGSKGSTAEGAWVEGNYLHHIASDNTTEYRYLGTSAGAPGGGALAGSFWMEGNDLHYLDESAVERVVNSSDPEHGDASADAGSLWVETYMHWIQEAGTTEYIGHDNVAHSDGSVHTNVSHSNSYSDTSHSNFDDHSNTAHYDWTDHTDHDDSYPSHLDLSPHGDTAHSNFDDHSNVAFVDSHGNTAFSDHTDYSDVDYVDQPTTV